MDRRGHASLPDGKQASDTIERARVRQRGSNNHRQQRQAFSPTPLALTSTSSARSPPSSRQNAQRNLTNVLNDEKNGGGNPTRYRETEGSNDGNKKKQATKSILVTLSDNCRKHQLSGQHHHHKNCYVAECWNDVPKYCQEALETLKRILPKVEQTIQVCDGSASNTNKPTINKLVDLGHMCDFYNDVLVGGFCPNALYLFDLGKGAIEILPRSFSLFRHLASESIIRNITTQLLFIQESENQDTKIDTFEMLRSSVWFQICRTIASLMDCVPDTQLQLSFISDLIQFASDLSVLMESDIFLENVSPSFDVQVVLFEETRQKALSASNYSRQHAKNSKIFREYAIPITTLETLLSLKASVFLILNEFLVKRKERRLRAPDFQYDLDESRQSFSPDRFFSGIDTNGDDNGDDIDNGLEVFHTLLASLRQTLLPVSGAVTSKESENTPRIIAVNALKLLGKLCATKTLLFLQSDLQREQFPSGALFGEAYLLIVQAGVVQLQEWQHRQSGVHRWIPVDMIELFSEMIQKLISPSSRDGYSFSSSEMLASVEVASFTALFQALSSIDENTKRFLSSADAKQSTFEQDTVDRLNLIILRSIHLIMRRIFNSYHTTANEENMILINPLHFPFLGSLMPILNQKEVKSLINLLRIPRVADHAAGILSLLLASTTPNSQFDRLCEINRISKFALRHSGDPIGVESNETAIIDDIEEIDENNVYSGSKRKDGALNASPSPKRAKIIEESWCLGDEIVHFLSSAHRSATYLREKNSCTNMATAEDVQKFMKSSLFHVQALTSAALLLTVSSETRSVTLSRDSFPFLCQLLHESLESLRIVGECTLQFVSRPKADIEAVYPLLASLSAFGIGMSVVIADSTRFSSSTLTMIDHSLSHALLTTSKTILSLLQSRSKCANELPELPMPFHEAVVASMIAQVRPHQIFLRGNVTLFDEHVFMVDVENDKFVWISPFMSTMNRGNDQIPLSLVQLVTIRLGRPDIEFHGSISLEEAAVNGIKLGLGHCKDDSIIRLLLLQLIQWLFRNSSPFDLYRLGIENETNLGRNMIEFITSLSCMDPDAIVRTYASRVVANVLACNSWKSLLACFSTQDEWRDIEANETSNQSNPEKQVVVRFFQLVDNMLCENCSFPQSQLSFTVGDEDSTETPKEDSADAVREYQGSAIRFLVSLFQESSLRTSYGRLVGEYTILRVVRFWAATGPFQRHETAGLCYAELARLSKVSETGWILPDDNLPAFIPPLVRDILIPNSSAPFESSRDGMGANLTANQNKQFQLLSRFIQSFLICSPSSGSTIVLEFLEFRLPSIISELVVEKDYDALRLTTAYKLHLLRKKRAELRMSKKCIPVVPSAFNLTLREIHDQAGPKAYTLHLEDQTREQCLAPNVIERIIPLIFGKAGRSELVFFTSVVLQGRITLHKIITSREQLILKDLILELGRATDATSTAAAVRAIKTAAIARTQDVESAESSSHHEAKQGEKHFLPVDDVNSENTAVSDWVTAHFMYLLVNVVQYRWSAKACSERVVALRCLSGILGFLRATESPKYFPQVMATIGAAIGQEAALKGKNYRGYSWELRLLAVSSLSKFVKLASQQNWETVGHNLTSIVVSLVPLVAEDDTATGFEQDQVIHDCRQNAVDFLEWLAQGDLGNKLSGYFAEIPFLPSSPLLDSFRCLLRNVGVDFDNLYISNTQGTQQDSGPKNSLTSDAASVSNDDRVVTSNAKMQTALTRRLEMIRPLLANENASIRSVTLQHLAALLRSNRALFYSLVENEGSASMKRYLTIAYRGTSGVSRGAVTEIVEALLARCVHEDNPEARILLAKCFGEVGAISEHRLEELKPAIDSGAGEGIFCSTKPPWRSRPTRYELQLVTTHLVIALKAAATASDQHKIAYTIQELLSNLDKSANESGDHSTKEKSESRKTTGEKLSSSADPASKRRMSIWLSSKLSEADVLEIVEPFWFTEFHEAESAVVKQPPFFQASSTFYGWLSNWCRYMVHRSHNTKQNRWSDLFYACRTAVRTQAGLGVAEFLLPMLVLDRLCFGNGHDEQTLLREIKDALTFDTKGKSANTRMNKTDRQKAASVVFNVIDLLQSWSETETEQRHSKNMRRTESAGQRNPMALSGDDWPQDESVMRIDDMIKEISLDFRATAASSVGMHAYSLRLIEMSARARISHDVFDANPPSNANKIRSRAAGSCPESQLSFMKDVLASLNDYETMAALGQDDFWSSPIARAHDSIRRNESLGNWEAAMQDYERAQQLNADNPALQLGALRCLLELGHFESALHQVNGILRKDHHESGNEVCGRSDTVPVAVEAAWRLGRWDTLAELVEHNSDLVQDCQNPYQICLGEVMLNAHLKKLPMLEASINKARCVLLEGLSSVSRESYSRAYNHVVRLQALREIEDVADSICSKHPISLGEMVAEPSFSWGVRLDLVSAAGTSTIINTRLALARLSHDHSYEGSLFLTTGKRARKRGLFGIAANSFAQSEAALASLTVERRAVLTTALRLQFAKLKHDCGESSIALRMLGQEDFETMASLKGSELEAWSMNRLLGKLGTVQNGMSEKQMKDVFVRSSLQSTRWMMEGGLKGGGEIMARFKIIHNAAPKWEKGHFQFAKYIDAILGSRIMALEKRSIERYSGADEDLLRCRSMSQDKSCQNYVLLAMKHYVLALSLDLKHVYQALPRLLSLWFDFTSIKGNEVGAAASTDRTQGDDGLSILPENQEEANAFMAKHFKDIPAQAFYTAMPQLISRITHGDQETAYVVQGILKRVLTKFPAQAMWPLAWVRQSRDSERRQIGNKLFREAERALSKDKNQNQFKLLVASKSLLSYLHDLAKYDLKDKSVNVVHVKPWKGEVELQDFIPPIQAALSVLILTDGSNRGPESFPRHVPRMRAFESEVQLMSSKARPKKIKVYAVSAFSNSQAGQADRKRGGNAGGDIGEIHFLVKQEAKGDLRKDARVQDLNNVINRIMSASNDAKGAHQRRRLHLRTFAVTCLSEETGLLEWVPHTDSFRNLVSKCFNPQASPFSSRRRGKRIASFTDPQLRDNFENKCQPMYFKSGNLTRAAALFEELCLKPYPPLLYWWFVHNFPDPHTWYEARTRFALSAAIWSAVGHVIGLGDRHSENILVDTTNADCVHVDFDCIFDKGLHLPKPEVIPFRLTQNMLDAFGPTGADGVFSENLKVAMATLRHNRDTLLSVLEPFAKDPIIDWKRYRSQQRTSGSNSNKPQTTQDRQTKEAKRSINVIDERLRGIYNLTNPNYTKIQRTDAFVDQQDEELSQVLPLSVEGQVHKMIAEATSHENLVQLYVGWMPWV